MVHGSHSDNSATVAGRTASLACRNNAQLIPYRHYVPMLVLHLSCQTAAHITLEFIRSHPSRHMYVYVVHAGNLPARFKNLPKLRRLWLTYNDFTGSLPAAWGEPGAFPKLKSLTLSGNRLSGSVPSSWGNASAFPSLEFNASSREPSGM